MYILTGKFEMIRFPISMCIVVLITLANILIINF